MRLGTDILLHKFMRNLLGSKIKGNWLFFYGLDKRDFFLPPVGNQKECRFKVLLFRLHFSSICIVLKELYMWNWHRWHHGGKKANKTPFLCTATVYRGHNSRRIYLQIIILLQSSDLFWYI